MSYKSAVVWLLLASVSALPAASIGMRPGQWEITTTMEMTGMPMKMPPTTVRHCYTQAELDEGKNAVPQAGDKNCTVKEYKIEGNTATWSIACTGKQAMTGKGTMTWTEDSYTGTMKSTMTGDGETYEATHSFKARRIGDCNP